MDLPASVAGNKQRDVATLIEPLESTGIGLTERLKQTFYVVPSNWRQDAFKLSIVIQTNALVMSAQSQVQAAPIDGLDGWFSMKSRALTGAD